MAQMRALFICTFTGANHDYLQIAKNILKTVCYFDVFDYPLTRNEIKDFLQINCTNDELDVHIQELINTNQLNNFDGYLSLHDTEKHVENRIKHNQLAKSFLPKALENGRLIARFPFVEAVFISGSLSKQVMHTDGDIDYFIISKKNRIWISKFWLKLYKYFYLSNSYKEFCINYFMADHKLEIKEKNLFTAIELVTIIPIDHDQVYKKIIAANHWMYDYLPNFKPRETLGTLVEAKKSKWTKIHEGLYVSILGNGIDWSIMKLNQIRNYIKYWKKYGHSFYELRFRSTNSEIKLHEPNSQVRILDAYHLRTKELALD